MISPETPCGRFHAASGAIGYAPRAMRALAFAPAFAFVLALALAVPARADEVSTLGFTPDGSVAILLERGTLDGSGFPWARATLLDARKRAAIGKPLEVTLDEEGATEEKAVAKASALAEAERVRLKLPKLVPGKTIAKDDKGELYEKAGPPIGTLEVKVQKAPAKAGKKACDEPYAPLLLTVKLLWAEDEEPAVLLADKTVPKDRPCLLSCTLVQVFAQAKTGLVVLRCAGPGFEGSGGRFVPVIAQLKYGLDEDLPGSTPDP